MSKELSQANFGYFLYLSTDTKCLPDKKYEYIISNFVFVHFLCKSNKKYFQFQMTIVILKGYVHDIVYNSSDYKCFVIFQQMYNAGFTNIDAFDGAAKMLKVAELKNVYQNNHHSKICFFKVK